VSQPKILVYDIETSPSLGWAWTKWDTNINEIAQDWHFLCFAYKWLGDKSVRTVAQPDFVSRYRKDRTDDYDVVKALWHLFDEADIVVAHNGNRFDQTKTRARFLQHGFDPPSPFREVDTLREARRHFNFISNSLDDLCRQLGIGRKAYDGGFNTWLQCMAGDKTAWSRMLKYNKQDVNMLEALYLRLLPWMEGHPNMALISDRPDACTKCGSDLGFKSNGWRYYQVTKRRVFKCKDCGASSYGRVMEKSPVTKVS